MLGDGALRVVPLEEFLAELERTLAEPTRAELELEPRPQERRWIDANPEQAARARAQVDRAVKGFREKPADDAA